jgi:outer membrane protein OmpA-like peptidoglycan-associated protein
MRFRNMMLATVLAAVPLVASADPIAGLYVGAGAGLNIMQDETVKSVGGGATPNTKLQMNLGGTGVGAVGWGFGNGFRAEFEFDYRYNGLNKVSTPFGTVSTGGSEQKYGPMVNVLYDFNYVSPMIVPYLGAGIGYQWASDKVTGGGSATAGAFAYQAILGVAFPINSVPGLAVTAEYRFMGLAGNRNYSFAGGSTVLDNDYNHSVLIGLRYAFGQAPAPMPAAMPMADMGAKTFLVFFDWNKYDLTARSAGIVQDAANYSTSTKYVRIDVDGNTDTSGTPGYNMGLSERRARVVAAELVRDGVPQSAISMHAYGDTHLLVPTGPDTREPQNRRVDIVFH